MRSHDLLFVYSSACRISSLVAGQSRRFGKRFLLPILSILVLFSSGLAGVASAGVNAWTTNGPDGGPIAALAIDPSNPATLYAGTEGGGVFKSTNGGGSWSAINNGLNTTFVISAIVIDPDNPGNALRRDQQRSRVWRTPAAFSRARTAERAGQPSTPACTSTAVFALAIDPSAPTTLYASTYGGGVFKSTNGGGSWSAINTGLNTVTDCLCPGHRSLCAGHALCRDWLRRI